LVCVSVVASCAREPVPRVAVAHGSATSPEVLILYSIDFRDVEREGFHKNARGHFRGWPVVGKVEIKDPAKRREIVKALRDGIARSDGTVAKCFWPRHGLHVVEGGIAIDYIVCFECYQLTEQIGEVLTTRATTRDAQPTFNAHLKEAGVPLVP
jgi:hypothetical protein